MLVQAIYTSTAAASLGDAELGRILEVSIRNNAARGITGLLVYAAGRFIQVLEGEEAVVDALLADIAADARHRDFQVLVCNPIREREFSQWHMGFRRVGVTDLPTWPRLAPFFEEGFDPRKIGAAPGMALDILRALADAVPPG